MKKHVAEGTPLPAGRGVPPLVCKLLSVLTTFPISYAMCKGNHRIIKDNVAEGTPLPAGLA